MPNITDPKELSNILGKLNSRLVDDGDWVIEKEPHNYNDGTTEFTHVTENGGEVKIAIARYVTPELAEWLVFVHNNRTLIAEQLWRLERLLD